MNYTSVSQRDWVTIYNRESPCKDANHHLIQHYIYKYVIQSGCYKREGHTVVHVKHCDVKDTASK